MGGRGSASGIGGKWASKSELNGIKKRFLNSPEWKDEMFYISQHGPTYFEKLRRTVFEDWVARSIERDAFFRDINISIKQSNKLVAEIFEDVKKKKGW